MQDYWSMSTPELEAMAAKFRIDGYADQDGYVDRSIIIDQLVKRDQQLNGSIFPFRGNRILRDLLSEAFELRKEVPLNLSNLQEWFETAKAAVLKLYGDGNPLYKNFTRAHDIIIEFGDTQENIRNAATDALESAIAILSSAIKQLGWDRPHLPKDNSVFTPIADVEIAEGDHVYELHHGAVFIDGKKLPHSDVVDFGGFAFARFHGESIPKLSRIPFKVITKLCDFLEIVIPTAKKNVLDWGFVSIEAGPFANVVAEFEVAFRVQFDAGGWNKNYTLHTLSETIKEVLAENDFAFQYWQANEELKGFGVSSIMHVGRLVGDALALTDELPRLSSIVRAKLNDTGDNVLQIAFDFPAPIKNVCEQYLMYFGQFLLDLGINATAKLEESANSVLFSVIPGDGKEALTKVEEALRIYLGLPMAPDFMDETSKFTDVAVVQWQANVLHLQSQITLAKVALQMQNATIEAKDQTILALQERLDLRVLQPVAPHPISGSDKEELVKDLVAVTKWEYRGLEFNLPEALRKLKRKFKKNE